MMKAYTEADLLRLAKRYNNKKRAYLLVDPLQGKHMPAEPREALAMMQALGEQLKARYEGIRLVIGFAETATAIGGVVAAAQQDCVYLTTTREECPEVKEWVLFLEEHSHAAEQKLCADDLGEAIAAAGTVVFVDDEISTGKTLCNMIKLLKEKYPQLAEKKLVAASIINRTSPENEALLKAEGITCECLLRLEEQDFTAQVADIQARGAEDLSGKADRSLVPEYKAYTSVCSGNPRRGVKIADYLADWQAEAERLLAAEGEHIPAGARLLVLGTEECMLPGLLVAARFARAGREVRYHATTRSPIGIADAPDYPITEGYIIDSFYEAGRVNHIYDLAPYDAVLVVSDSTEPPDRALTVLTAALGRHGYGRLVYLGGVRAFGSYRPEDVTLLLKDITGQVEPLGTAEREARIQGGCHYSEMLPLEYEPSPKYFHAYQDALQRYAQLTAKAVGAVAEWIYRDKGPEAVLVSLARAGTPVGILIKRYLREKYGLEVAHYAISIIRGRGIDDNAMQYILSRHPSGAIQFVDGWTGKGAIQRTLAEAIKAYPGVSPGLAVLSDPAHVAEKTGTYEDFLIASSCLNSTVSGLLSRTFLRGDIIGPRDFHGSAFYAELADKDVTYQFIDTVAAHFDFTVEPPAPLTGETRTGLDEVKEIAAEFGIADINLVKPSIGEATRVLLRRVPWKLLVKSLEDEEHLGHLYQLAKEKEVEVVVWPLENYLACGLIKNLADS